MSEFFSGTWPIDAVIALTLVEGFALALYHRRTGRGIAIGEFGANLAAGLCLMLALRGAVSGAGWAWIAPCLLGAGFAHGTDLWRRWRRLPPPA